MVFRCVVLIPILFFVLITGALMFSQDRESFYTSLCYMPEACNDYGREPCVKIHEDAYQTCYRTYYCNTVNREVDTVSNVCYQRHPFYMDLKDRVGR